LFSFSPEIETAEKKKKFYSKKTSFEHLKHFKPNEEAEVRGIMFRYSYKQRKRQKMRLVCKLGLASQRTEF